jgi:hypothetical protein
MFDLVSMSEDKTWDCYCSQQDGGEKEERLMQRVWKKFRSIRERIESIGDPQLPNDEEPIQRSDGEETKADCAVWKELSYERG